VNKPKSLYISIFFFSFSSIYSTGTGLSSKYNECQKALRKTAYQGNWEQAKRLVQEGTDPNLHLKTKKTGSIFVFNILTAAIRDNRYDVVTFLLEHHADPREIGPFGLGSLHVLFYEKNKQDPLDKKMIKLLLDFGANPNETNRMNNHPLWESLEDKDLEILKLFVKAGADIMHTSPYWSWQETQKYNPQVYAYLIHMREKRSEKSNNVRK